MRSTSTTGQAVMGQVVPGQVDRSPLSYDTSVAGQGCEGWAIPGQSTAPFILQPKNVLTRDRHGFARRLWGTIRR